MASASSGSGTASPASTSPLTGPVRRALKGASGSGGTGYGTSKYGTCKRVHAVGSRAVAQAREPLSGVCPSGVNYIGLVLYRLPGEHHGLYGDYDYGGHERRTDKHDGRIRPVCNGLDGDDGRHDDTGNAPFDPALPRRRPPAPESGPGKSWHCGPVLRLHSGLGCCRTTCLCLCLNGPKHRSIRSRVTDCTLSYRGRISVHFTEAQLPRTLQQPAVLFDAEVETGNNRSAAARGVARPRLPGLLRGAHGRVGGTGHDEPCPGVHGSANHLRREDIAGKPSHRASTWLSDDRRRDGVLRILSARWDGSRDGAPYGGSRDTCCGGQHGEHGGTRDGIHVAIKRGEEGIYRKASINH